MDHKRFILGRIALDAAHYSLAKVIFLDALDADPLCAYGLYILVKIGVIESREECLKYEKMFHKRMTEIFVLADSNDAEASFVIGVCYEKGLIEEYHPEKIIFYYKKSFRAGNLRAGFNLACYFYAHGEVNRAISIYEHLCTENMTEASVNLAYIYLNEKNFKNFERGFLLMEQAANQGDVLAHFHLGMIFLSRDFHLYDAQKAIYYLKFAAQKNNVSAIMRLAQCYENGEGTEKDLETAKMLYQRANILSNQSKEHY